jgi:hypothetical protein
MRHIKDFKLFEGTTMDEFSSLFLELELDYDLNLNIEHNDDEFGEYYTIFIDFNSSIDSNFGDILYSYIKRALDIVPDLKFESIVATLDPSHHPRIGTTQGYPISNQWEDIDDIKNIFKKNTIESVEIVLNMPSWAD